MIIKAIKTRKFTPPKDDLWQLLGSNMDNLQENSILVIASKVVAIGEGKCLPLSDFPNKDELVKKEADLYLERNLVPHSWMMHTLKNNLLIGSAGIDESNGDGYYILWPENPEKSAEAIYHFLREKTGLKNLGVIITDSHSVPLRRGLVGISLAYFGFEPLKDYRGEKDLFGKELVFSMSNLPDSLAAGAVLAMGEGNEQTPMAVISDLPEFVKFTDQKWQPEKPYSEFNVEMKEDLFAPFLKALTWKKGG